MNQYKKNRGKPVLSSIFIFVIFAIMTAGYWGCSETPEKTLEDGRHALYQRKYPEAIKKLQKACEKLKDNKESAALYRQALKYGGQFYFDSGEYDKALDAFIRLKEIVPDSAFVYYSLGLVEYKKNNFSGALKYFETSIQLDPALSINYLLLGKMFGNSGEYVKAAFYFKNALLLNPADSLAYFGLGASLLNADQIDSAQVVFENALEKSNAKNKTSLLYHLAIAYNKKGDAVKVGETVAQLKKLNEGMANKLTFMLAQKDE